MKIIMLGPPGAGKGTQAAKLSAALGIPTLSTGHILRTAIKEGLPVGLEAKSYMDAGKLVPDEIIIKVVKEFLDENNFRGGYILDGMPRTLKQAEMLEEMGVEIDVAILLEISDKDIEERMKGRRACPVCGTAYNIKTLPPRIEGICDICGEALIIRDDDKPETLKRRLAVYHEETEPIIGFYEKLGKLKTIDGKADIQESTAKILNMLELIS